VACRHRRLRDAAGFGRTPEVLFFRQRQQEFKFVDQEVRLGKPASFVSTKHNVRCITKE